MNTNPEWRRLNPEGLYLLEQIPAGVVIIDDMDNIVYFNRNLSTFGIRLDAVFESAGKSLPVKQSLSQYISDIDLEQLRSGLAIEHEIRRVATTSDKEIALILKGVPLENEGQYNGALVIIEDIPYQAREKSTELIFSDATFSSIVQSLWSFFVIVSVEGKILYTGGQKVPYFTMNGAKRADSVHTVLRREISSKVVPLLRAVLLQSKTEEFILDIPSVENPGDTEYYECFLTPLYVESLKSSVILFSVREITTFLKMIETLKQENTELRQHYDFTGQITQAVVAIEREGRIQFWNHAAETMFKFRRSEVYGKPLIRVFPAFTSERLAQLTREIRRKASESFLEDFVLNDGTLKTIFFTVMFAGEDETSLIIMADDQTEAATNAREAQKNLLIHEEYFRTTSTPSLVADERRVIVSANPSCIEYFGAIARGRVSLVLDNYLTVDTPDGSEFSWARVNFLEQHVLELRVADTGGNFIPFECFSRPLTVPGGGNFTLLTLFDMTAQNALKYELETLRSIFDFSNDGIALEYQDNFILVNEAFAKLYGYASTAELIGNNSLQIVAEEEMKKVQDFKAERKELIKAGTRYEFLAKRKDESRFYAEVTVNGFKIADKEYNVILARDVTERKRQQQAIKESEERYRSITENIDDFFWTAERSGFWLKPIFYTASVEKITGYTQVELLGDHKLFWRLIYPDDIKNYKEKLKRYFGNYYKRTEEIEFRIINRQGAVVWVRNKMNVVRNRKGKVMKLFGLVSDVTLQKRAEEELRHSTEELKKLNDTKDKFISIISHDLRTPFSSILGFTDILLNEDDLTAEESKQYVRFIEEASTNMLNLVNSLLDWTRIQTGRMQFEPVNADLREIVESALKSLSGVAIQKGINLFNEIEIDTMVFVDKGLLMQVVGNLVSNSLKFTPEGGGIFIRAEQSAQPRFIKIEVMDTGVGIKPENLGKIFSVESKFTTVGTSGEKGTGLGLSFVKEIIEKHGGRIWVESQMGNGTTFSFLLPKASATILLVDDSQTDRILFAKILKSIVEDYEIITAENGKEALDIISKSVPSLIICDHTMPIMDGLQFMAKYNRLQIKGKPPVIILSSDLGKSEYLAYADLGLEYVFSKPVSIGALKSAVEKSLKKIPR